MAYIKEKLLNVLFPLYLILFPFGQVLHDYKVTDIIVLIISVLFFSDIKEKFKPKGKFLSFIMIGVFALTLSTTFFGVAGITEGLLYFVRLVSFVLLFSFVRSKYKSEKDKELVYQKLLFVNFFVVIFGFVQYFFFPDLRYLKTFGWDDHYFRLVSTFLDPAFTGIIMLLGLILSLNWYIKKGKNVYLALGTLNLLAIALTYSRSTYLALVVSLVYFAILIKRKFILIFPLFLLILIPLLPRPSSEGVKLERTYSIFQKFDDYGKATVLISKSPVFGIGFNNTCVGRETFLNESGYMSHSCSGIDNSILFILATTGVVGFIFFVEVLTKINFRSASGVALVAVLTHSMFTNTLFYPFVMGYLAIILALSNNSDI